ncbi:antitoxin Xre/MbcA/ParS toxin-binding domain-containing protein [Pseudomonas bohemica]|uniref:antitoxin Xre/MbcA/ParS toxin-binding domain-containing protein n=1 Tax=Pseudomonas bohemica TaxID=2044872 RepID=UPI000DA5F0F9|nr:antitoxin Xre/MbcA/ParS toxin-binding domain-containing protein [Pseudomonas bohemica]
MVSTDLANTGTTDAGCSPTAYFTQVRDEQHDALSLYTLVQQGFALDQVKAMVASSELYSSADLLFRITGQHSAVVQPQSHGAEGARLSAQQSAVAFQFAKALEHAMAVFGGQRPAELWLASPCRFLAGNVPLDMIDNALGFHAVEVYLTRVEHGVYQ